MHDSLLAYVAFNMFRYGILLQIDLVQDNNFELATQLVNKQ